MEEGGSGALGINFLNGFNKKLKGKWRRKDPEPLGSNSLMILKNKLKEKWRREGFLLKTIRKLLSRALDPPNFLTVSYYKQ